MDTVTFNEQHNPRLSFTSSECAKQMAPPKKSNQDRFSGACRGLMKGHSASLLALALILIANASLAFAAEGQGPTLAPSVSSVPANKEYKVQPGDRLFISVWREEALQREVVVQPDGAIRFPLAGEVNAAGLSLAEIENRLRENLTQYIPDPVVTVSLFGSTGNKIYVVGKVNAPGEFVLTRNIDVLQAIALARGMTPFAKSKKITILRDEKGSQRVYRFNYKEVSEGKNVGQNIQLIPGDTVVVP